MLDGSFPGDLRTFLLSMSGNERVADRLIDVNCGLYVVRRTYVPTYGKHSPGYEW